ncbi:MAG TPA: DMT family transporter [Mesorhizobium sp.]|jgi:drug/metabolite transporter (DMT)-like permease|nr:DMT family transporter [Mesorhizobium sp.]
MNWNSKAAGILMVPAATLAWSFSGLFTPMLAIDMWTAVAWRSFAGGAILLIPMLIHRRSATLAEFAGIGRAGWIAVAASTVAQACTVMGLFLTSVAHVTVIYAICPFIAAIAAWLWLGEAIPRKTLVAIAVSFAGVAVVVAGSLSGGTLLGDAVALLITLGFALMIVLSKAYPDLRILAVMILSTFLTFLLFLPFSTSAGFDAANMAIIAAYGFTNVVLAYFLFVRGAPVLPAATSDLISTLETVVAPFWVWLFFDEQVDTATFAGGALVIGAVAGHLLWSSKAAAGSGTSAQRTTTA